MNKKLIVFAVLLLLIPAAFAFNPFYRILGLFVKFSPEIEAVNVYPEKIRPGDVLLINVTAKDVYGIEKVTAKVYHESGFDIIELSNKKDNNYQGTWVGHNIVNMKWYDVDIEVTNKQGVSSFTTTQYQDPTKSHPAAEVTAGTFDVGDFSFQGNVTAVSFYGDGAIPSGGIIMWSGSIANIPDGWALCNGSDGTPDLRDRFIVGAGGNYSVADVGGEANHTLTIAEMPSHTHGMEYMKYSGSDAEVMDVAAHNDGAGTYRKYTTSSGGDEPHENRPPYYALAYIMKL